MAISATGLGSGLDISGLVKQLVDAERAGPDLQIARETAKVNTKLSAMGSIKGAIAGFQNSLNGLNVLDNYGKRSVTSSNSAAVSATVTNAAVPNSYTMEVSKLAEAHALAGPAFADSDTTAIGTGTLTFRWGTTEYDPDTDTYDSFTLNPDSNITTLTIDSSNNTLEGVMNAINEADFGVTASIVNDGSGYRLLMTSEKTGVKNSLEISAVDGDDNHTDVGAAAGLSNFAFNASARNMEQTNAAANAVFKLNGLTVQSQDNTTSTAIPGLTLTLKETTSSPLTLKVEPDTTAAVNAFNTFIAGYNQFRTMVNTLTNYNAATKTAGTLLGDFTVRSVVTQVEGILRNDVDGTTGEYTTMADIGLKTNSNGTYALDTAKFKEILTEEPETVSKLFAALGVPTDSGISYQSSTKDTAVGTYAVNITTAATSASLSGTGALPDFGGGGTLTIDADNDSLAFEIDGVDIGTIALTQGTYTSGADLAAELQARINGAKEMVDSGKTVSVGYDAGNDRLTIQSAIYGNTSQINVTAVDTNTAATLGFTVVDGTPGVDVAGTINGKAATGAGQLLTANAVTDNGAEGLSLTVTGSSSGARGSVNFTRGVTDQLKLLLGKVLEAEGALEKRIDNYEDRKALIEEKKAKLETKMKAIELRYSKQFNALDGLLSSLQSTSSYLQTQLANLPGPRKLN
ncbi:MAG: flagellar filament capping protein FliD [Gammaproteobacteria bacterium]